RRALHRTRGVRAPPPRPRSAGLRQPRRRDEALRLSVGRARGMGSLPLLRSPRRALDAARRPRRRLPPVADSLPHAAVRARGTAVLPRAAVVAAGRRPARLTGNGPGPGSAPAERLALAPRQRDEVTHRDVHVDEVHAPLRGRSPPILSIRGSEGSPFTMSDR